MGNETFKKRQKEAARREKRQKKTARRMERRSETAKAEKRLPEENPHIAGMDSRPEPQNLQKLVKNSPLFA